MRSLRLDVIHLMLGAPVLIELLVVTCTIMLSTWKTQYPNPLPRCVKRKQGQYGYRR